MIKNNLHIAYFSKRHILRFSLLLAFMMLCSTGAFAQSTTMAGEIEEAAKSTSENVSESHTQGLEMVKWFLGGAAVSSPEDATTKMTSAKKALINAGMKPNRILNNSFLKKAINYDCITA